MKRVLIINSGSSSIKYQLFDMDAEYVIASGSIEQIGENEGLHRYQVHNNELTKQYEVRLNVVDHEQGLALISEALIGKGSINDLSDLDAIGHRVVHGGELFKEPTVINTDAIEGIRNLIPLAPLHNPANLMGIEIAYQQAPVVPQVAVFDTAFHQSIPEHAYRYAIPNAMYTKHGVRRYGFHGTSHQHVAEQAAEFLQQPLQSLNLITLHLGNGASAAAISKGQCVDTSMGMTPTEGLMMGTRCGDLDPAIPFFLERLGMSCRDIEDMLNRESGLRGICSANDMRKVHQLADSGDENAELALEMYCYRIRKTIGAYFAVLGKVDAVIFTGGIGENDARIRSRCCDNLGSLGILMDETKNRSPEKNYPSINQENAAVKLLVIPTNEELEIARQTVSCIS